MKDESHRCHVSSVAGCGKTTLLSVLAGSVSSLSASSRVYGQVTLDGQPRRSWASRLVAYVPQFDFLLPTLTVAETLRYSAQLRLPRSATAAEVKVRSPPVPFSHHPLCACMLACRILHREVGGVSKAPILPVQHGCLSTRVAVSHTLQRTSPSCGAQKHDKRMSFCA